MGERRLRIRDEVTTAGVHARVGAWWRVRERHRDRGPRSSPSRQSRTWCSNVALIALFSLAGCQDGNQMAAQRKRIDSVAMADYQARLVVDSHLAESVRVVDSASVKSCRHIQVMESSGQILDADQSTREIRLRSQAAQVRANAVVVTTPSAWKDRVRGEAYHCGPAVKPDATK